MGRTKNAKDYLKALHRLKDDCNKLGKSPNRDLEDWEKLLDINERVSCILGIANSNRKSTNMLFFVMYDIESNKVRRYIVFINIIISIKSSSFFIFSNSK